MNITDINTSAQMQSLLDTAPDKAAAAENKQNTRETERLKKACNDFETILIKTVLKQGMQNAKEIGSDDGDSDNGSDSFREIAYEQMAEFMGQRGSLGLGKMLYNSFENKNAKTTGVNK